MSKKRVKKRTATTRRSNTTKSNPTQSPKATVNTSIRYALLTDNEDEMNTNNSEKSKAVKIPPIICIDAKHDEIIAMLNGANIVNFNLKYISMGIRCFVSTLSDFGKVCEVLKNRQKQYFTHDASRTN